MADVATCDQEPIHIPGLIQPHGILFALTNPDFRISAVSANIARHLGHDPKVLLNTPLERILPPASFELLKQAVGQPNENPVHLVEFALDSASGIPWRAIVHVSPDGILLEALLPQPDQLDHFVNTPFLSFEHATRRLQAAKDSLSICAYLANEVRRLTHYNRVMIYRFAADNTGEVVAEDNSGRLPSYLGLNFPASDIPTQAHALYLRNPDREIPDVDYTPVPLIQADPTPIDLSSAFLRSVSPVHLEYLRNMAVGASMSVSIVRGNALWGLVACHHLTTHFIPAELRQACVLLAQLAAWQLASVEEADAIRRRDNVKAIETILLRDVQNGQDCHETLLRNGSAFLDLVQADGVALCSQGTTTTIGMVPAGNDLLSILRVLEQRGPDVVSTDTVGTLYPPGAAVPAIAGVLAVPLGGTPQSMIVWFRSEIMQTVKWAGDPAKPVTVSQGLERLTPRRSFEAFKQEVRGRSRPWQPDEIAAATDLGHRMMTIVQFRAQHLALLLKLRTRELKETQEQLIQAAKLEALGTLTGGLAHDFNNMLAVIILNLDVVQRLLSDSDPARTRVIEALASARSGAALIRRLLAFARRQPLQATHLQLNDIMSNVQELLGRTLREDIEIVCQHAPDLWPVVTDASQVEACLLNLVANARDAMPNGGRLTISTANRHLGAEYAKRNPSVQPGDYAMIAISDTGSGMPPDVRAKIFEPFFTTKEQGKGTGLGLSMVYGFIVQSGGHVSVDSKPGVGTTIRLFLPRAESAAGPEVRAMTAPKAVEQGHSEVILVVEDNAPLRATIIDQLAALDYRCLEAASGPEALAVLEAETVSLVFSDVVMPGGMNGFELAEQVKRRWPSVKVLLTSGFSDARPNDHRAQSCAQVLSKPYGLNQLATTVREVLDAQQPDPS